MPKRTDNENAAPYAESVVVGCTCVSYYNEDGCGVIERILPECPYHKGVHPLDRLRQSDGQGA